MRDASDIQKLDGDGDREEGLKLKTGRSKEDLFFDDQTLDGSISYEAFLQVMSAFKEQTLTVHYRSPIPLPFDT